MTFSEHLLQLRKEHNLEQMDLVHALHTSLRTYQRYEHGEQEPRISMLIAIADFYGITLDDLVCRNVPKKAQKI